MKNFLSKSYDRQNVFHNFHVSDTIFNLSEMAFDFYFILYFQLQPNLVNIALNKEAVKILITQIPVWHQRHCIIIRNNRLMT